MLFKEFTVLRCSEALVIDEAALAKSAFVECEKSQASARGWVPIEGDSFLFDMGRYQVLRFREDEKKVSPSKLKAEALKRVRAEHAGYEDSMPPRALLAPILEVIMQEQLCVTLPTTRTTWLIYDKHDKRLVVGATAAGAMENATSFLRCTLGSLPTSLVQYDASPSAILSTWLCDALLAPGEVGILPNAELATPDGKSKLDGEMFDELVEKALELGGQVVKQRLLLEERISFDLMDDGRVKRMVFADEVSEPLNDAEDAASRMLSEIGIMAAETTRVADYLGQWFGEQK